MHLDALFPIIIFVIVTISKMMNASRQTPPPKEAPHPMAPRKPNPAAEETEQERYKRFMEAVGLPPNSPPPGPVRPRTGVPAGPLPEVKPPPVMGPAYKPGRARRVSTGPSVPAPAQRTVTRQAPARSAPPPAPAAAQGVAEPARVMQQVGPLPLGYSPGLPPAGATAKAVAAVGGSYPAGDLLRKLRDPKAIREAIVMREVLGPPKALQPGWPKGSVTTVI